MIKLVQYETGTVYGSTEDARVGFPNRFYIQFAEDRIPSGGDDELHVLKTMHAWCLDQYGPRGSHMGPNRAWNYYRRVIGFRHPHHAMAFKLRFHGTREFDEHLEA